MIRPIAPRDAAAWAAMRARLWPEAEIAELVHEAAAFANGGSAMIAAAFIAETDDARPAGFLELAIRPFSDGCDSMPVPHVEGWYVEPFVRCHGVGKALMREAEQWARERGFTELASDTEIHNTTSLRVHLACGFEEVERLIKFRKTIL